MRIFIYLAILIVIASCLALPGIYLYREGTKCVAEIEAFTGRPLSVTPDLMIIRDPEGSDKVQLVICTTVDPPTGVIEYVRLPTIGFGIFLITSAIIWVGSLGWWIKGQWMRRRKDPSLS